MADETEKHVNEIDNGTPQSPSRRSLLKGVAGAAGTAAQRSS